MTLAGVFALIYNEKQELLLCLRNDYDLWNLPGGGLEENESPWEGILREIKEEIGADATVERLSGLYWRPEKHEVVYVFLCHLHGVPTTSGEAREVRYFPINALPKNVSTRLAERVADSLVS
ncbi:MAG: NUDIX domain-containing protein [Actinomycetota bacterium]|nr:NUDIX domain-containing protein [Actinomycetota bacterium]